MLAPLGGRRSRLGLYPLGWRTSPWPGHRPARATAGGRPRLQQTVARSRQPRTGRVQVGAWRAGGGTGSRRSVAGRSATGSRSAPRAVTSRGTSSSTRSCDRRPVPSARRRSSHGAPHAMPVCRRRSRSPARSAAPSSAATSSSAARSGARAADPSAIRTRDRDVGWDMARSRVPREMLVLPRSRALRPTSPALFPAELVLAVGGRPPLFVHDPGPAEEAAGHAAADREPAVAARLPMSLVPIDRPCDVVDRRVGRAEPASDSG